MSVQAQNFHLRHAVSAGIVIGDGFHETLTGPRPTGTQAQRETGMAACQSCGKFAFEPVCEATLPESLSVPDAMLGNNTLSKDQPEYYYMHLQPITEIGVC
ncbi:unnamed protein product [Clonostachys rosea f. rosea IK726]|uniref:Uncharacterized protein n=2 Tax=Bionectria ochroleuca TaxID=29856 RepID=A0A0B7JLS0_BIOOC|nr:unnamed protein product [Clonostachys rosea f. rosea IK726]